TAPYLRRPAVRERVRRGGSHPAPPPSAARKTRAVGPVSRRLEADRPGWPSAATDRQWRPALAAGGRRRRRCVPFARVPAERSALPGVLVAMRVNGTALSIAVSRSSPRTWKRSAAGRVARTLPEGLAGRRA